MENFTAILIAFIQAALIVTAFTTVIGLIVPEAVIFAAVLTPFTTVYFTKTILEWTSRWQ